MSDFQKVVDRDAERYFEEMPVIEINRFDGSAPLRIWANGRTEGVEGIIINRIPAFLASRGGK